MLNELINKINLWGLRLKLCFFLLTPLIFLITRVERIDDMMSKIIKLNWICLYHIKILVCVVFQIILVSIDLGLLVTKDAILLQVEVLESWLLLVQHLDFFFVFSMGLLMKYLLLVIFELFIIVIWGVLLYSFFAFQALSCCQRPRINSIIQYLIVLNGFLLQCLLTMKLRTIVISHFNILLINK